MSHLTSLGQPEAGSPTIVQHFAAAERIPYTIKGFIFDSRGLLWITSDNDNIRLFDGTNVRVLESPFANGIPQFEFSGVLKDSLGNPCFISLDHEFLFRLDAKGELVQDTSVPETSKHIYNDGEHNFDWSRFVSAGRGPAEKKDRQMLRIRAGDNDTFAAFDDSTFCFKEADSLFIFKGTRLLRLIRPDARVSDVFTVGRRIFLLGSTGFMRIDDRTGLPGRIPVSGDLRDDSLFSLGSGRNSLRLFRSEFPHVRSGNRLYRITCLNDSLLSTVLVGDIGFIQQKISKIEYEPHTSVTAIATLGDGLYILKANPFYSRRFDRRFLSLKRKMIFSPMAITPQDSILTPWCKFSGDGRYRLFDPEQRSARTIFADWAGNVWMGLDDRIVRYDQNMVKQSEQMLPSAGARAVDFSEALPGQLFCFTDRSILRYRDGRFADVNPSTEAMSGEIRFQQVRYIGNGIFWLAANKGIYRYDEGDNSLKRIEGIPDVFTLNIVKLGGGSIILSCYPQSFYYLFYRNRFFKIPVESDLPLKETASILEDGKGRIWFATGSGFFVTTEKEIEAWCDGSTRSIYYYRYGADEGLHDLEFKGGMNRSNARTSGGYLAFNSMAGLAVFHEDSIREIFPVGGIQLFSRGTAGEEYLAGDTVLLPHENEGTILQVRMPFFGSPDNLRIEYALEQGDPQWRAVGQHGRINLQHLAYGTHYLSVRVRTGLLPGNYRMRRIAFVVPPLFYETKAFRIIVAAVLIVACLFTAIAIVRLRKEVRIKNLALYDQNFELQSTLEELQENMELKEKLISLVLHDLKTPLYFQSLLFNQIVEGDYFKDEEALRLFQELKMSSSAILQFTKEFLTWYSSQREGFQVRKTLFHHKGVVNDLFSVYGDIALRKNLRLHYESNGLDDLFTDRTILEIIIRNLLDNAIKYTAEGAVSVIFGRKPGMDSITVSDTGKGMSPAKIKELEESALRSGEQASPTFGYRFIYAMAEKIGAGIRITSEPAKGTSVTIMLLQTAIEPAGDLPALS